MNLATYRRRLKQVAPTEQFVLFSLWLRYWWSHQRRRPLLEDAMSAADYAAAVDALTEPQLEELWWRGLVPPPGARFQIIQPFSRSSQAQLMRAKSGVRVVDDPLFEQRLYLLPTGEEVRLRLGELEQLASAGYPATRKGLIRVLCPIIGPSSIEINYSVPMRLRAISAALHTSTDLEPAELLDQLRKLVLPPSPADHALVWLLRAEHDLLELMHELVGLDTSDHILAHRVRAWRAAQGILVFWNAPDLHTQIAEVARVLVPTVAADGVMMDRIEAVWAVVTAAVAVLGAEPPEEFDDGWFEASTLRAAVVRLQRAVSRVSGP
ncbi:MAG TPA: hypothetical protein VFS21_07105 [Roseiflexaceae bacterium]|nr:hypothetical protein [Roseiflexaceae bacterium]